MTVEIRVLSRRDLETLMPFAEYVDAVAEAFRLHAGWKDRLAGTSSSACGAGEDFTSKREVLTLGGRSYVAVKTNANFPQNRRNHGLPSIQGAVLLLDGKNGTPLALLNSVEITIKRTAAAMSLAARHLARRSLVASRFAAAASRAGYSFLPLNTVSILITCSRGTFEDQKSNQVVRG